MIIKQLSIFIENKTGRINDVTRILAEADINMSAFCIAENADFGIMRVIVSDPQKAVEVLKLGGFAVSLNNVVCLTCANKSGTLNNALTVLAENGVFIEYMYAFANGKNANVVIKPNNIEKCIEVLQKHSVELFTEGDFYQL